MLAILQPSHTMAPTLPELTSTHQWTAASERLSTLARTSPEIHHAHANWTPLHHVSCALPTPHLLHQLLNAGASPHVTGPAGSTPLHLAAWHGTSAVETLLSAGANGNSKTEAGRTPLHFAAKQGHAHVVRALLEKGCVDGQDVHGVTAREMAEKNGLEDVVKVFEEFENENENVGDRGIGSAVTERVRSLVETVGKDVVVAGSVGFLLGALVPKKR